uniref:Active regulator of SIRT1 n=1 Tax=Strongyloides stercoralis TaxID=6248 RepID=A0A0K0EMD7_STRER
MTLDLISKSLDFVDRDITKDNYQSSVKNKKGKNAKNKTKRVSRSGTLTEARKMFKSSAAECTYDERTGEIVKEKRKYTNKDNISNILSSKRAKKGECLIDQYRIVNSVDEDVNEEELTDNDNCEEKLDIDNINTIVKFVYEESNNRKKALKTLDRSQHGRKRVHKKTTSKSIFKDSDFEEISKKNNTIILNSKAKKLTSEDEIKKALGIKK